MKGTVKSGKGRFLVTLLLVLLLIATVLTISVTIGAVNVSAGDIGKILVNKSPGRISFELPGRARQKISSGISGSPAC